MIPARASRELNNGGAVRNREATTMDLQHTIFIRVRYVECDSMGYLHHSHYLPYFEMGRTELLRQLGVTYRDLEDRGFCFVVARITVNYKRPIRYDEEIELLTRIQRQTRARIDHAYEIYNRQSRLLLTTAESTIACVNQRGEPVAIPDDLSGPRMILHPSHNSPATLQP
ncbi:MAG: thioesterase family protein [Planctomycetia bacterium]|nr:thioesterase family protein [Planctomycetia bacterium]